MALSSQDEQQYKVLMIKSEYIPYSFMNVLMQAFKYKSELPTLYFIQSIPSSNFSDSGVMR